MSETQEPATNDEECTLSQRVDGKKHTWRFDGDDPYIFCHWCGEMRDAITGRVIRPGRTTSPRIAASDLTPKVQITTSGTVSVRYE
jgi:hypothetical protein